MSAIHQEGHPAGGGLPAWAASRLRPLVPWLLAAAVTALSLLALVHLDAVERDRREEEQRNAVLTQLNTVRAKLESALNGPLLRIRGVVAQIIAHDGITTEEFNKIAEVLLDGHRNVRNMVVSRGMVIAMTYPLAGNEKVVGVNYRSIPAQYAQVMKAIETKKPVLQGPVPLIQGGTGLISRQPVFLKDGSFFGMVNIILDIPAVFREAGLDGDDLPITVAIRGRDGLGAQGALISGDESVFARRPVETDVQLPHGSWRLAALPKEGWGGDHPGLTQTRAMGAGIFLLMTITAFGTALYVTRRARAEAALRRSEHGMAAAQHLARLGSWELDTGNGRMVWSDEVFNLLGLARDPAAASWANFLKLVHPDDRDRVRDAARSQDFVEHRIIRHADREIRWVFERWDHGPGNRSTGTIQDVTEQKQTEQTLRDQTLELERSNADLERFAYVASHDLQTPLRNIISYAQLLERRYRGRLDSDADDFIDFIVEGTMRMSSLIRDLLDYARVTSQAPPLAPVAVGKALDQALANLATDLAEAGAQVDVADTLPVVMADQPQLTSLFQNLVGNAVRYRAPGRPPRIEITCRPDGPDWRITVADNGIGIDPEYFDKIFVIFQRLHPPGEGAGTGVGLAVCQRIVRRFGGDIWVESTPGQGATFCFTLPASVPEVATMDDELKSLLPKLDLTRRAFVGTALAATGFAMAAGPAGAQAIVTDDKGLIAGPVLIPARDRDLPAYVARPKGDAPAPVVLVVQEIFGVHEHIRDVCRRLAKQGYLAIAPELYVRQGDPSAIADIPTLMKTIVSKVPDEQVMADLDACAAWAGKSGGGDGTRLGITGFCWGGRIAWLYAAHNPKLRAAVAWYGRLVGEASANTPRHPVDLAAELTAPVLGLYGGADQGIPLDSVEKMRARLKPPSEIVVYDGAPHAFHADYRSSYRPDPAKDGWARMLAWFRANGVA